MCTMVISWYSLNTPCKYHGIWMLQSLSSIVYITIPYLMPLYFFVRGLCCFNNESLFCSKQIHHKCFSVYVNSVDINAGIFMPCHSKDFSMSVFWTASVYQVIARLIRPVTQPSPCAKVNKAIFFIAVSVIREGHEQEKILLMFGSFMLANEIAPPSLRIKPPGKPLCFVDSEVHCSPRWSVLLK